MGRNFRMGGHTPGHRRGSRRFSSPEGDSLDQWGGIFVWEGTHPGIGTVHVGFRHLKVTHWTNGAEFSYGRAHTRASARFKAVFVT